MKNKASILGFFLTLVLTSSCLAQLQGEWLLTVNHGIERLGLLTFGGSDGELEVFVDGGLVDFVLEGNTLEMDVDYRDGSGRLLSKHFSST